MTQTPLRPVRPVRSEDDRRDGGDVAAAPLAASSVAASSVAAPVPALVPAGAASPGPRDLRAARRAASGSRRPWVLALVVYTAFVAVVVGWPTPVDAGAHDALWMSLHRLHGLGVPTWVDYDLVERSANTAMFVPLGLLVTRVTRRWWWGLAVPAALSGGAELSQHLLRPDRFATWTDLATNTSGAAVGVVLAVVLMARRRRARAPR